MVGVRNLISRRFEISSRDSGRKKLIRTLAIYKLTFVALLLLLGSEASLRFHITINLLGFAAPFELNTE